MRIVSLQSENVKRLSAVEITPDGNVVIVGGENAQGKSSVLDSIAYALGGKDLVCEDPIRHGERSAKIRCDLGEIVVTRTFTSTGGSLKVTKPDGSSVPSPQTLLDSLVGSLSFDPLEFSRMKSAEQSATLRKLVGIDTATIDAKRKAAYDARTLVNRDVKSLEAQVQAAHHFADAPAAEVTISELSETYRKAVESNNKRSALAKTISDTADRIKTLKAEIERLETASSEADFEMAGIEPVEVAPIKAKIDSAESDNRKVRANAARATLCASLAKKVAEAKTHDSEIEKLDDLKTNLLKSAKFPVEGLTVEDSGVMFNGVPFLQSSSAEQLRVSLAMGLAMNPKLKVMLIRDGSLLDSKSLAIVAEMAKTADAQVWIERVGEGSECSVIIEDGHVKGTAQ